MNFNMHGVVRGAIQDVNLDVPGTVYISTGRAAVRGILTPTYTPVLAKLQIQAKHHTPVTHERGLLYSQSSFTIYAYGSFSDVERPSADGGDVVTFNDQWYYISQVLEWWPGWCSFDVTKQLNADDIAALLKALQNGDNP